MTKSTKTSAAKSAPKPAKAPAAKDHPDITVSPPLIMLLMVMAGIVLDWLLPVGFGHGWGGLGLILLLCGLGVIGWCRNLFTEVGTNINPAAPTTAIVEKGPYAYSRNPIYVGFLVAYAGLAMLSDAPLMLLLTGGLWYILDSYVIEREEAYLSEKFGEAYTDYQDRVRRWV